MKFKFDIPRDHFVHSDNDKFIRDTLKRYNQDEKYIVKSYVRFLHAKSQESDKTREVIRGCFEKLTIEDIIHEYVGFLNERSIPYSLKFDYYFENSKIVKIHSLFPMNIEIDIHNDEDSLLFKMTFGVMGL